MLFTDAIRIYLESFRLPGESQKIERIMSCFAGRFYEQNKDGKGEDKKLALLLFYRGHTTKTNTATEKQGQRERGEIRLDG